MLAKFCPTTSGLPDLPAIEYDCYESTLRWRYNGQMVSREEIIDLHHAALTRAQEKALVDLINRLIVEVWFGDVVRRSPWAINTTIVQYFAVRFCMNSTF